jgi:glycine/D-amino acid oxidase-like deaminating enzyme
MTDNSVPRFHCFARNVIGVCGYNGRGIAPGTAFGRALADTILGTGAVPLPVSEIESASLRVPRELAYEYGAQALHALQYHL